jgi:hypothetical protein
VLYCAQNHPLNKLTSVSAVISAAIARICIDLLSSTRTLVNPAGPEISLKYGMLSLHFFGGSDEPPTRNEDP